MRTKKILFITVLVSLISFFTGCDLWNDLTADETPTKTRMEGVWEVTAVYDSQDTSKNIVEDLMLGYKNKKVPFYFHLSEDGDMESTAGPLFMYLVYGGSNWTNFFGKLDEVFNYMDLKFTNGDWGIDNGVVTTFTIQGKIMPPSMKTFTDILELFGVKTAAIKKYLIHRFVNVTVNFIDDETMYWEITDNTDGYYFTENSHLDQDSWSGWDASKFSRCRIEFTRVATTITNKINELK